MLAALDVRHHLCKLDWKVGIHRKRVVVVDNSEDVDGIRFWNRKGDSGIALGFLKYLNELSPDVLLISRRVHTRTDNPDNGKVLAICS